jgi:hypothetical protein
MKRIASMAMVVAAATLAFATPKANAQDCYDINNALINLQADLDTFLDNQWSTGSNAIWQAVPGQLGPSFIGFDHAGVGIRLDHQLAFIHAIVNNDPSVVGTLDPAFIGQVQAAFLANREHIKNNELTLRNVRVRGTVIIISLDEEIDVPTNGIACIDLPAGQGTECFDVPSLWTLNGEPGLLADADAEEFILNLGAAIMLLGDDAHIDYFRGFVAQLVLGIIKVVVPSLLDELFKADEFYTPFEVDILPEPKVASYTIAPTDIPLVNSWPPVPPGGSGSCSGNPGDSGIAICIGTLDLGGVNATNTRVNMTRANMALSINTFIGFFTQTNLGFSIFPAELSPGGVFPGQLDTNLATYNNSGQNLPNWFQAIGGGHNISINALTKNTIEVDFGGNVSGATPNNAFVISGPGQGTLTSSPVNVSGSGSTRVLEWPSAREGLDGEEVTITIAANAGLLCGTLLGMSASGDAIGEPPFVASRVPAAGASVSPATFTSIQVNFNQEVTGVVAANLTIDGFPATNVVQGPLPSRFTFTGFPAQSLAVGIPVVLAAGNIQDLAGNAFEGANWTYDFEDLIDTVISSTVVDPDGATNVSPTPLTITFDEGAFGLELSDFSVTNGTAQNLVGNDGDEVWTVEIVPASDDEVMVELPKAAAVNFDASRESQEVFFIYNFDGTPPVVTIDVPNITGDSSPQLTGTVVDEDLDTQVSITVGGHTVSAINNEDGTWTLPAGTLPGLPDGLYDIDAEAVDTAGNSSGIVTAEGGLLIDSVPPIILTVLQTANTPPFTALRFDAIFSEPVVGVTSSDFDLNISGGTLNAVVVDVEPIGGGDRWRANVVLSGQGPGTLSVTILDNGTITDAAGLAVQGLPFVGPATVILPQNIASGPPIPPSDDPNDFPPPPPASPIAGPFGLAALAAGIAAGGAVILRRRRKS